MVLFHGLSQLNLFFLQLALEASFGEVRYVITEEDGFLVACVMLDGQIQRDIVVQLSTLDGSATGMIVFNEMYNKQTLHYICYSL